MICGVFLSDIQPMVDASGPNTAGSVTAELLALAVVSPCGF